MKAALSDNDFSRSSINALRTLGSCISISRRARKIRQEDLAAQSNIGINTMVAVEKGMPSVKMGHYLMVLENLGLVHLLEAAAKTASDELAVEMMTELLPKRATTKSR